MWDLYLWHMGSSTPTWDKTQDSLRWECGALVTGLLGKSQSGGGGQRGILKKKN